MKTDLTTSGSFIQSKTREKALQGAGQKMGPGPISEELKLKTNPDYKLDLSSKTSSSLSTPTIPSPSLPSLPSPTPSRPAIELDKLGHDKMNDVLKDRAVDRAKTEVTKVERPKIGTQKAPAIIFVKGLDIFSSPSTSEGGYAGVGEIADSIEGSRIYSWDQKEEIIGEINKVHPDFPVILVGHSLGGDTAVEIASELDSLNYKFRPVDLLITIDAVGFNNDIIPQNVKRHLNVFGESSYFFNDGPHVARRNEMTEVTNILSPRDHTDIDDDKEIQFEIVNLIQKTLSSSSTSKRI